MQLTCPKCHHHWSGEANPAEPLVQCPDCFEVVQYAVARQLGSTPPPKTPSRVQPKSPPIPASIPSTHTPPPRAPIPSTPAPPAPAPPPPATTAPKSPSLSSTVSFLETTAVAHPPRRRHEPAPLRIHLTPPDGETPHPVAGFAAAPSAEQISRELTHLIGKTLAGYQIAKDIGAGGTGAVFLARQISLDRMVALKILAPRFSKNPDALARFTREAVSAAQLDHPNIIQVHDVGCAQGYHYLCMEYVPGQTLAAIVRRNGRLPLDEAAGYVLQAARGLKYAHERGVIHRDIKPENLMLDDQGVVKIADMGLAKRACDFEKVVPPESITDDWKEAGADLTWYGAGMGTPMYIAPEQAREAASVDARADQYSLGCTLYFLCTGTPPFRADNALELIRKHLKKPIPPLDTLVPGTPPALENILSRLTEKDPAARYPDMSAVVKALEHYLGIDTQKGTCKAREQHLAALDECHDLFYAVPLAHARDWGVFLFFYIISPLAILLSLYNRHFVGAGGWAALVALTPAWNVLLDGLLAPNPILRRLRGLVFGMPLKNWFLSIGTLALATVTLYYLNWLITWLVVAALALVLAAVYQWGIVRRLRGLRAGPIEKMRGVLRDLRLRGLGEEGLQNFVAGFTGLEWEEFFENLFGYEAMCQARLRYGEVRGIGARGKFATWRDPLVRRLEDLEASQRIARSRRALAHIEAKKFQAAGIPGVQAAKKGRGEAKRFIEEVLKVAPEEPAERHPRSRYLPKPRGAKRLSFWFSIARAVIGLTIMTAWLIGPYSLLFTGGVPFLNKFILPYYLSWGWGAYFWGGLVTGLLLVVSAFSQHTISSILVFLGALFMVLQGPVIVSTGNTLLTPAVAFWLSAAFIVAGLLPAILGKLSGGRF